MSALPIKKDIMENVPELFPADFFKGHCPTNEIMNFFEYKHLPAHLQQVSKLFFMLAMTLDASLRQSEEKTTMLRKLLEAKDCAVRASMPAPLLENKIWNDK
jgi:hypothetical protein